MSGVRRGFKLDPVMEKVMFVEIFIWFWSCAICVASEQMVTACAVVNWYFWHKGGVRDVENAPKSFVKRGFRWTFR